jgi:hypothetical protein
MEKHEVSRLLLLIFLTSLYSCNRSNLIGTYEIDKIIADTTSINYLTKIHLLDKDRVLLVYRNDVLQGKWHEKEGLDYHVIELFANETYKELEVYENMNHDNSIKLYFIGKPIDFRGGIYDSLNFIKVP